MPFTNSLLPRNTVTAMELILTLGHKNRKDIRLHSPMWLHFVQSVLIFFRFQREESPYQKQLTMPLLVGTSRKYTIISRGRQRAFLHDYQTVIGSWRWFMFMFGPLSGKDHKYLWKAYHSHSSWTRQRGIRQRSYFTFQVKRSNLPLGPVSQKSQEPFAPEKPTVKLQSACLEKLTF